MLHNHLEIIIRKAFPHSPTSGQGKLFQEISKFILSPNDKELFLIKGFAGTGKTSSLNAITSALDEMKIPCVLLAPTGRAAKVISQFTNKPAFTIHKQIYRQKSANDAFSNFVLDFNPARNTLFIVDEASMINDNAPENSVFGSGKLLDDLFQYVYNGKNCKLVLVGDIAQLPPVGLAHSPALQASELHRFNKEIHQVTLTEIVRQKLDSGILFNATQIRNVIEDLSTLKNMPKINVNDFPDVIRLSGNDILYTLQECYEKYGIENTMVICRSNKQANRYNAGIRSKILYFEEQIEKEDYLMVVKNNYFWQAETLANEFIANGDIAKIVKISNFQEEYGFHYADAILRFPDYDDAKIKAKIFLDTLTIDAPSMDSESNKNLFWTIHEDYKEIKTKKERYRKIKENPYFNALQVKFSYSITCHKAQGGQWKAVFIDQGWIDYEKDTNNMEYLRWFYTALTRAVEKVYLVNFKDEFFEE